MTTMTVTTPGMALLSHLAEWPVTSRPARSLGVMDGNVQMSRRCGR
jgi:hypothetical protein